MLGALYWVLDALCWVLSAVRGAGCFVPEAFGVAQALLHQQVDVVEQEASAVGGGNGSRRSAGGEIRGLRENPRIAEDAAAYEHAVDALGAVPHPRDDVFRLDAIAAAEHGNRQAVRDLGDEIPVGVPAVALRRGAAVDGDGGGAGVLHHLRERRRVPLVVIPAGAHLHGHGNFHGARHRGNHRRGVRGLAHQAAAGVVLRDLRHRAAHVDVHDVGAHALDDLRRRSHRCRVAAEDLDRDRPLWLRELGVLERAIDAAHEPFRAHHLGDDEAAAAVTLHEPAEGGVGHARHRGNREGRR